MSCPHRFTEMVTAAHADGMCPLCMAARIERLETALTTIIALRDAGHPKSGDLDAAVAFRQAERDADKAARAALAGKEG